ncbi:carbohydrate-binding protein [Arachidicoccus ginsenosidivorans]|uniref:carbohydrate-binding protein n=1 Tax=Arachidicoccus ginsenosidivorans TaxID=496057 RepID=UPI00374235DC
MGIVVINFSAQGDVWKTLTTPIENIRGVHDLFFVFKGNNDLFNFDWWKVNK